MVKGEANQALLDSYEAERRPVALTITASGDAMEELLTIGDDPAARAARDHTLREHFADPDSNHQEVVAEVELDVDYAGSPIVSGEPGVLAAGARIPAELQDVITVPGHTLVVVATDSNSAEAAPWLLDDLGARTDTDEFFDDSMLLNAVHDPDLAAKLGVNGLTILAVRPDGYVGFRHDGADAERVQDYVDLVRTGGRRPD